MSPVRWGRGASRSAPSQSHRLILPGGAYDLVRPDVWLGYEAGADLGRQWGRLHLAKRGDVFLVGLPLLGGLNVRVVTHVAVDLAGVEPRMVFEHDPRLPDA